jgi:DNA-binding Lrp family transcriptional regulator
MPKLSDRYYSGREVQRKLGITEPALRNLVNQKKIRKIIPPGKQYGVYLREEIDTYAEKWLAFLTAQEPPKTTFEIASIDDMKAVYELSIRAIGRTMDDEVRKEWHRANPENCLIVKHANKVVAFFHLLPLKHDTLMKFMEGNLRGWEIKGEDVEPFQPGKPLECLAIIASEPDVDETTRMHYVRVLLRGLSREFRSLGERGVIISKIYATSQTPTGIAMAIHAGMKEYGERLGKRLTFIMDVDTSSSFLVASYKEGYAEWQKQNKPNHKSHTPSNVG